MEGGRDGWSLTVMELSFPRSLRDPAYGEPKLLEISCGKTHAIFSFQNASGTAGRIMPREIRYISRGRQLLTWVRRLLVCSDRTWMEKNNGEEIPVDLHKSIQKCKFIN
jgi:hypothetical protein